jgi:hypothetical protein
MSQSRQNIEEYERFYDTLNTEIGLLFQRLNYFLVASAFLVTAFATVLTTNNCLTSHQFNLAFLINLTGFYLSVFFAATNYLNIIIIQKKSSFIKKLKVNPKLYMNSSSIHATEDIIKNTIWKKKFKNSQQRLVCNMLVDTFKFFIIQNHASGNEFAPHTYLVPLGFSLFWLIILFAVLMNCIEFGIVMIFMTPLLIWILMPVIKITIYKIRNIFI